MSWIWLALVVIIAAGLLTAWYAQRRAHPLDVMLIILLVPLLGPAWFWGGELLGWARRGLPAAQGGQPRGRGTGRIGLDAALGNVEREVDPSPNTLVEAAEAAINDHRAELAEHYFLQAIGIVASLETGRGVGQVPESWRAGLARAQLEQGKAEEALQTLTGLSVIGNESVAILTARALDALDRLDDAALTLEPYLTSYSSEEVPFRYAGLMERRGARTLARRLYEEMLARADGAATVEARNLPWLRAALEQLNQMDHPTHPPQG